MPAVETFPEVVLSSTGFCRTCLNRKVGGRGGTLGEGRFSHATLDLYGMEVSIVGWKGIEWDG